jgi:hypothetical protein
MKLEGPSAGRNVLCFVTIVAMTTIIISNAQEP